MTSERPSTRPLGPTTRTGRLGTWLALLGTALFAIALVVDALRTGADWTVQGIALWIAWIAILGGGAVVIASMLRERERGLLALLVLIPFALLLLAFAAEFAGLLE